MRDLSRRGVVFGSLGLWAGCRGAAPRQVSVPAPPATTPPVHTDLPEWEPGGPVDLVAFPCVAAADVTHDAALVAARTLEPTPTLELATFDGEAWRPTSIPLAAEGVAVVAEVVDLPPDTVHRYVFRAPDGRRSEIGRFRTAPPPGARRPVVLGATSCLGSADPTYACLRSAAEAGLDGFVLLGDAIYTPNARTLEDYRAVWDEQLATPSVRRLLASVGVAATWDDHEVADNWTTGEAGDAQTEVTADQLEAARRAFVESLPIREGDGLWRSLRWGDAVELFVLDCRGERAPGRIVSPAQLAWLESALPASSARFKLVASSVHVADHSELFGPDTIPDRWQGHPEQRERLIALADADPGVVFLTGDFHYGGVQRLGPGSASFEICAGPAGSAVWDVPEWAAAEGVSIPPMYELLLRAHNWVRIAADPDEGTLVATFFDGSGAEIGAFTVDLGPARR